MSFGFALLGGAAVGAAGGLASAAGVHGRIWEMRLADADALERGQVLGPMPEPPSGARPPRRIVLQYVLSILASGFAVWLVSLIFLWFLSGTASGEDPTAAERIIGAGIFAAIFGTIGFLIPGAFIGILLHFRENRARLAAAEAALRHQYWEEREELRHRLEAGTISVSDAIHLLRGEGPSDHQPLPTTSPQLPLPEANAPITPKDLLALASAVARHGYVGVDAGPSSTAASVTRILTDPNTPERTSTVITSSDIAEAENAVIWAMHAFEASPRDEFRERVGSVAVRESIDPQDHEAIRVLAAGVGAFRRAMVKGNY